MTNIFLQTSKILQLSQVYLNQNIIWETSNLLSISFFFQTACVFSISMYFSNSLHIFMQHKNVLPG